MLTQATQVLEEGLQNGVAPEHWVFPVHCTHRPGATEVSQTGVAPEQPLVAVQATQRLLVVSQTGVAPEQSELPRQVTQKPFAVSQTGLGAAHSALPVHELVQVLLAGLQTGVAPEQLPWLRQPTHEPPVTLVSQIGVAPEQPAVAVQVTQPPAPPLAVRSQTWGAAQAGEQSAPPPPSTETHCPLLGSQRVPSAQVTPSQPPTDEPPH